MSEYAAGARNAVRTCLGIRQGDRVAVVKDRDREDIASAIEREAEAAGATVRSWTMEDWVERPARELPARLAEEIAGFDPTASFFIGEGKPGELAFRQPLLGLLTEEMSVRHG